MPSRPRRAYMHPDIPAPGRGPVNANLRRGSLIFLGLLLLCISTLAIALGRVQAGPSQSAQTNPATSLAQTNNPQSAIRNPKSSVPPPYEGETPGQPDQRAPDRQGGPDAFGYIYSDNRDPGGPVYNWIPGTQRIHDAAWQAARSTETTDPWDDGVITHTLPFVFNFYGVNYTQIHVATNGNVHFGLPNDYWPQRSNECVPSTNQYVPKAMIAPLWFDFVVPLITETVQMDGVYTDIVGTAPNRIYVVEWRNVYQFNNENVRATVETLLYENGDIVFQYQALNGAGTSGSLGVVGIHNAAGSIGLPYLCYQDDLSPNRAVRYRVQQDVFLQPGSRAGGGAPGATVTYTESVVNATGMNNSFALSVASNVWTTTVNPPNTGLIPSGGRANVTVQVQIPPGTPLGESDTARLDVSSDLPSPGTFTDSAMITTTVSTQGVDFAPDGQTRAGNYGSPVTFTTSLINRSGQNNSFVMSLEGAEWASTVTPTLTGELAPDASTPITVTVLVPPSATLGASDVLTLTATGQLPSPGQFFGQTVLTATAGVWVRKADMPLPRSREAAVAFPPNGRIYVLGGEFNNGSASMPIMEYDPLADTWTERAYLGTGVSNVGAGVIGNAVYIPGGFGGQPSMTRNLLQAYYPLEDRVETITSDPMPAPRFGAGVAVLEGKLYVIGGSDDSLQAMNTVFEYDPTRPAGSRWQTKNPMPTARVYLGAAALNGLIYAVGGVPGGFADLATVERYDPDTGSWTTAQPMSTGRGGLAVVGVDTGTPGCGGYLYAIGGGYLGYKASAERYDPITNSWEPVSSLTLARRTLAATYSPNTYSLFAVGGWTGNYEARSEAILCSGGLQPPSPTPTVPVTPGTPTSTATPGTCTIEFQDVPTNHTFHPFIRCLACRGILSGYPCGGPGEPCVAPDNLPYFRPNSSVTRGQLTKIVSEAAGFDDAVSGQTFEDVPPGSTFYTFTERLRVREVMGGYLCGGPGEPCVPPSNRSYFRPNSASTRGQLTKIVSNSAGFIDPVSGQTFEDVPPGSTFYTFTERLASREVMGGYPCGGPGEPCLPPTNRPYFRPNNTLTRGQTSKIVSNTFFPNCNP
ncbi:MAG: hypothetical protein WCD37_08620 [Chloroflexia bacterium]